MKLLSTCAFAVLTLANATTAFAQTSSDDEIVVTGKYLFTDQVNALKSPTPIIDVPQSLSIITAEQITNQGFNSIADIIDYTPGVNTSQGEGHRDAVVFRGVRSTADFFLDGVRDDVQYYRPLYNLQQVEILKGPNALLFGRGGTGGILNRVTKKGVIGDQFTGFKGSVDTFGAFDASVDLNFATSETSALRVNAFYESLNNHRDFFDGDRIAVNPTARFELSPSTTLDVSYEYSDFERFIDRGIPSSAPDGTTSAANGSGLRRPVESLQDITFGDENINIAEFEGHVLRANLQHQFNDALKGNFTASYGDYDKLYQNFFPVGYNASNPDFGGIETVDIDGYVDTTQRQNLLLAANLISEFSTGSFEHTLIFGGEFIDTQNDNDRFNTFFSSSAARRTAEITANGTSGIRTDVETFAVAPFIDFSQNAAGVTTTNDFTVNANDDDDAELTVFSAYVQNQIEISPYIDVILGARFDSFDFTVTNSLAANDDPNRTLSRKDEEISPRLGVILKPRENISIYGSYSESFIPQSGEQFAEISSTEAALTPDVFENLEAGVKWDFAEALSFTAAIFRIEATDGVDDGTTNNQTVEVQNIIEGVEFQLLGDVTEQLSISAGLSFLKGDRNGSDLDPRELPDTTFNVWGNYQVTDKLGLGLGLTHQSESFSDNNNTTLLPSYTRLDAAAFYDVNETLRVQLNIENLTDEFYFPNSHTDDQISVGAPLNARFTVSGRF